MQKSDVDFLGQMVNSLEEAHIKLEKSYNKKDQEGFDKAKKFILQMQRKIGEVIQ